MSDHLPECHLWLDPQLSEQDWCICDRLRACEARITAKYADASALWGDGYEHGLSAARDAVAAADLCGQNNCHADALAAIDALRGVDAS